MRLQERNPATAGTTHIFLALFHFHWLHCNHNRCFHKQKEYAITKENSGKTNANGGSRNTHWSRRWELRTGRTGERRGKVRPVRLVRRKAAQTDTSYRRLQCWWCYRGQRETLPDTFLTIHGNHTHIPNIFYILHSETIICAIDIYDCLLYFFILILKIILGRTGNDSFKKKQQNCSSPTMYELLNEQSSQLVRQIN